MKLTSDLQADGHEIRRGRFEEGTVLPTNPFLGQLFHLKTPLISKVFYFDGTNWICGVTTLNGRQGDVTLTKEDVDLENVDNLKQQPWSPFLTELAADMDPQLLLTSSSSEIIRGHPEGLHFFTHNNGLWSLENEIPMAQVTGAVDLSAAADGLNNEIMQVKSGVWQNSTLATVKADLQLNNVDNTADVDKPISTATQAALTAESDARSTADTTLTTRVADEETTRASAITALTTRVADEETTRATGDTEARARANHTGTQSASTISDFSSAADARIALQKAAANGIATLGENGQIPSAQLPPLAITSTYVVNSQAAQLALVTQEGDVAVRSDLGRTYIRNAGVTGTMTDWNEMQTPTDLVLSVNGMTGAVTLTQTHVGLSNVDNTSDINKPISTATQTAINNAVAMAQGRVSKIAFTLPALLKGESYIYTHNLNSFDIVVGFHDANTYQSARLNYRAASLNTVEIYTDVDISSNAIRVVVMA